ncbi:hypothetical protein [Kitasatospora sp. NPDC018619]|uniref:hypothetical protein n=1 Tax=unclassified Kitasatospora TaxID=2633591 RepID=UPI00378EC7BA
MFEFSGMAGPNDRCLDGSRAPWDCPAAGEAPAGHALPAPGGAPRSVPHAEDETARTLGGSRRREARPYC